MRSRHYAGLVAVGGIVVVVALAQIGWKVLVGVGRDLIAWDDTRLADLENQLRRPRMAQAPDDAILEGTVIPPRQPEESGRQRNAVLLGVGLVAAARVLRNCRFDEQILVAIFAVAALSQLSWKELVRAVRDLIAWDNAALLRSHPCGGIAPRSGQSAGGGLIIHYPYQGDAEAAFAPRP